VSEHHKRWLLRRLYIEGRRGFGKAFCNSTPILSSRNCQLCWTTLHKELGMPVPKVGIDEEGASLLDHRPISCLLSIVTSVMHPTLAIKSQIFPRPIFCLPFDMHELEVPISKDPFSVFSLFGRCHASLSASSSVELSGAF